MLSLGCVTSIFHKDGSILMIDAASPKIILRTSLTLLFGVNISQEMIILDVEFLKKALQGCGMTSPCFDVTECNHATVDINSEHKWLE